MLEEGDMKANGQLATRKGKVWNFYPLFTGTYYYPDGDRYEGEYKQGKKSGKGFVALSALRHLLLREWGCVHGRVARWPAKWTRYTFA